MTPLLVSTALGTPETPTTAHLVARIARVLLPDIRTAVDLTPGCHDSFWSPEVPIPFTVARSFHDFRWLPFGDWSYDGVFLDPPHSEDLGKTSLMRSRYGTVRNGELKPLIQAGVCEAWRIARIGLVIKVCDQIHGQRFQAEASWVEAVLGEPYQLVYDVRPRPAGYHPEPQLSAYSNSAVYLIYRRGDQRHVRRGWQLEAPMP
jgi:hypothetical protein